MKPFRQKVIWGTKLVLGLALLGWVLRQVDWIDFADNFRNISVPIFIILLLCAVTDRVLMGWKWNLLLRANGLRIPVMRIISLYVVSNLLGAFTPGNLGADAYRVVALTSHGRNAAVLSTVVLERALGMLALLLFVIGSLPFSLSMLGSQGPTVVSAACLGSVLILLMLLLPLYPPVRQRVDRFFALRQGKLASKIHQFFSVFAQQQKHWRVISIFFLLTVLETGLFFSLSYLAAKAAGLQVTFGFIFSIMPVVMFVLRLPISIQGVGLQEGLFAYSFCLAGNSVAQGVLASLIWRLMDVLAVYFPGLLLLMFSPSVARKTTEIPTAFSGDH